MKQRGQFLVFYALMIPVIFLFLGVVFDFGWWFYNQARLQHAADAAVLAAAERLVFDEKNLSDYTYTLFTAHVDESLLGDNPIVSSRSTLDGDDLAREYINKDLSNSRGTWSTYCETNAKGIKKLDYAVLYSDARTGNAVVFEPILYGSDAEDYKALYYTVNLNGTVDHLFAMFNRFGKMPTKAQAVVKISHVIEPESLEHGVSLYKQMRALEVKETYADWESIRTAHGSGALADDRSVLAPISYYDATNKPLYRTETLNMNASAINFNGKQVDDMFVDFRADARWFNYNWDVSASKPSNDASWFRNGGLSYRVHTTINVSAAYDVRVDDGKDAPDVLYARIESEPMNADGSYSSSIRQIVININASNWSEDKRPIIFFYDGPEDFNRNVRDPMDESESTGRDSNPIILNLQADFRGILFAPNSPIAVEGNGHRFEGFIVGKSFVQLDKDEKTVHSNLKLKLDGTGNVQYKSLDEGSTQLAPQSIDPDWHTDDLMYNASAFNLKSSTYSSFNQVRLINYKNWNDGYADNFFLTNRSDWVD